LGSQLKRLDNFSPVSKLASIPIGPENTVPLSVLYRIRDNSDQGWQYRMDSYVKMLDEQSMSRKRNCLDNAVVENFYGLLKSELLYLQKFSSMDEFQCELEEYLDYYNNK